ncbi:MAG: osmotically inducible protein C, partial [Alphaproteobacteria bacterium]
MPSERFTFRNPAGAELAARLDRPAGPVLAHALFAHCFTCSKDSLAAARISAGLVERGFAVLRFDFTGLGGSAGEFGNAGLTGDVA